MYVLHKKPAPPEDGWVTLFPAVEGESAAIRVEFAPITRPIREVASQMGAKAMGTDKAAEERDLLDFAEMGDAYGSEIIRRTLRNWEGIGDADGVALSVSTETIESFIADDVLYNRAYELHVLPDIIAQAERRAEKKGLRPSPSGTGAGKTRAKRTASSRRAKPQEKGGAKPARTGSTPRRAKRGS